VSLLVPQPMKRECSCGFPLRWESRENYCGKRSLATCSNPECGVVTTAATGGFQPEDGLRTFLLGDDPVQRYLPPWARLYWKTSKWGYRWLSHDETCPDCASEFTVQLDLPPLAERQTDPVSIETCLACGATGIAWWLGGEKVAIAIEGDEWSEPVTAVLILKRVLEERAARTCEGWTWDFLR
jgi:hypothetical protein